MTIDEANKMSLCNPFHNVDFYRSPEGLKVFIEDELDMEQLEKIFKIAKKINIEDAPIKDFPWD